MKKLLLTLTILFASQAFSDGVILMVCTYEGGSQETWVAESNMQNYTNQCRDNLGGTSAPSLAL